MVKEGLRDCVSMIATLTIKNHVIFIDLQLTTSAISYAKQTTLSIVDSDSSSGWHRPTLEQPGQTQM